METAKTNKRNFAESLCRYYLPSLAWGLAFSFFAFSPLVSPNEAVQAVASAGVHDASATGTSAVALVALETAGAHAAHAAHAARTSGDGPASVSSPELDLWFVKAMNLYHAGHYHAAYGNLWQLADEGHADSARMALMMLKLGPTLYATQWAATSDQVEHWTTLAGQRQPKIVADQGGD